MFTQFLMLIGAVALFFWVLMYFIGLYQYHTDAMYAAQYGKPSLLPWKQGYNG